MEYPAKIENRCKSWDYVCVSVRMIYRLLGILAFALPLHAQVDAWDLAPIKYSDTKAHDRFAALAEKWAKDPSSLQGNTPLDRLRGVLAALQVPEASQILVFSKTSKQIGLITPANPRALFFSRDCYCGYVPGGMLEVVIQDKMLGPVYYAVDLGSAGNPIKAERDTSDCLSCHATARTENVPGMLVRSVYPDADGQTILAMGTGLVTHQTPIAERWGGYYVTGSISLPHLGNRTYAVGKSNAPAQFAWKNLQDRIDTSKYPNTTSDIVALMVLEHQCHAHNLMTAASMNYKRAYYLSKALNPEGDPDAGSAGQLADHSAEQIVEWFLFSGEAEQGPDGVEGGGDFQKQFKASIPHASNGDSLADFHLDGRLFKNRCSYMIYSEAFQQLPQRVKNRVVSGLRKILESTTTDDSHPDMKLSERRRTANILHETGIW